MQLPSVEVLSSWPTPNYDHPTHLRGPELLVVNCIFFPLAVFMVCLRIFTRVHISKAFGIDDIFLLAAILPAACCAVLTCIAVTRWGWNRHIWDVPLPLVTLGLKVSIAMECLFGAAVSLTKLSLLILTRRIMSNGTGFLRHVAAAGMVIVACEGVIFNLVVIFTCSPVSDYWTLSLTPQKCINERTHLLIGGIINTFTDFLVFFLPLPSVLSLKLHRRQQLLLFALFGAGLGVCLAGTVRIYYAWKTTSTFDRTWVSNPLWIASVLELDIGLMCTSIPACKPFFSRYMPALLGSTMQPSRTTYPTERSGRQFQNQQNLSATHPPDLKNDTMFYSSNNVFELQPTPVSLSSSRVNSKQLLPLSYLNFTGSARNSQATRSSSNSNSSTHQPSDSPAATVTSFDAVQAETLKATRVDSRENLVGTSKKLPKVPIK